MVLSERTGSLFQLPPVSNSGLAGGNPEKGAGHSTPGPKAVVSGLFRLPVVRRDAAKSRRCAAERMQMRFTRGCKATERGTTQQKQTLECLNR